MVTYSPRHRITIKSMQTGEVKTDSTGKKVDISDDVLSIVTNKANGRAFGAWQIITTFRQPLDALISSNDVILIELDAGDGSGMQAVMLGLVDRVARFQTGTNNGQPHRQYKISGRDMGKLLADIDLGWDISGLKARMNFNSMADASVNRIILQSGTAAQLIQRLFEVFQTQTKGAYYPRYITADWIDTDDTWILYDPYLAVIRDTPAWDAMKRVANEPWNRLFTETDAAGRFHLGLERQPITDKGKLNPRQFFTIDALDIVAEDLGKSDDVRVNLLAHWPVSYKTVANRQLDIILSNTGLTKFSEASAVANGIHPHVIETQFVPKNFYLDNDPVGQGSDEAIARTEIYWNWYRQNHEYESGSITVHGWPEVRNGNGLLNEATNMEYLIEQVQHSYSVWPQPVFTTTLHLTRGQQHGPSKTQSVST